MQDVNEDNSDINNEDRVSDVDEVADPTDGSSVEHSNVVDAEVSDVDNEDDITTFTRSKKSVPRSYTLTSSPVSVKRVTKSVSVKVQG